MAGNANLPIKAKPGTVPIVGAFWMQLNYLLYFPYLTLSSSILSPILHHFNFVFLSNFCQKALVYDTERVTVMASINCLVIIEGARQ